MAKLAMDPSTRGYLSQPDFMQMLQLLQKNPGMMSNFMQDQRFSHALSVSPQLLVRNQELAQCIIQIFHPIFPALCSMCPETCCNLYLVSL